MPFDVLSQPWARVPPKKKSAPILPGEFRLSGADRRIAKNEALRDWLAKCYAEIRDEGPAAWPCFSGSALKGFLAVTNTPIPAKSEKFAGARETALNLPAALAAPEPCVKALAGASFLSHDTGSVCDHLHRRRAAARR